MSRPLYSLGALGVVLVISAFGRGSSSSAEQVTETRDGLRETRITRSPNGHFYVDALVNGHSVHFLVDTGATRVALTTEDAKRAGEVFSPDDFEVVGSGASGPVRGQSITIDSVELGGRQIANLHGAVLEGLDVSLLGQGFLAHTRSVEMHGDEMVIR